VLLTTGLELGGREVWKPVGRAVVRREEMICELEREM